MFSIRVNSQGAVAAIIKNIRATMTDKPPLIHSGNWFPILVAGSTFVFGYSTLWSGQTEGRTVNDAQNRRLEMLEANDKQKWAEILVSLAEIRGDNKAITTRLSAIEKKLP